MRNGRKIIVDHVPCEVFCRKLDSLTMMGCARSLSWTAVVAVFCPCISTAINCTNSPDAVEYSGATSMRSLGKFASIIFFTFVANTGFVRVKYTWELGDIANVSGDA